MKTIFIPAKSRDKLDKESFLEVSKTLPDRIAILYSIQYEFLAKEIRKILEKMRKITKFSQVLGCTRIIFSKETKAVLLIGSGRFHAISLATISNLPIYIYEQGKLSQLKESEINLYRQRKRAAYLKFLNSNKIGVLASTKPGQQNLAKALALKRKVKDKQLYFFLGDFLSPVEFENFGLDSWINTTCPRLDMESSSIINISDLP